MKREDIAPHIAKGLNIKPKHAQAAVELLKEGNTVPFIARYRKEATGELDEEAIRFVEGELQRLENLIKRQEEILASIEEQGKLTDELKAAIERAQKLQEVEDIYLPYKRKRNTRAQAAREKGLEPLAQLMLLQQSKASSPEEVAAPFIDEEKGVPDAEAALQGARDILAETITEDAERHKRIRREVRRTGTLSTTLNEEAPEKDTFLMYQAYAEPIRTMPPHRILAINRGEKKDCLKVRLEIDQEAIAASIEKEILQGKTIFSEQLQLAVEDGLKRLLLPSVEREIRSELTEAAEAQAISVFGANLKQLLLQPPLAGHTVMGLDPGYRTGCKMAIVDSTGRILDHGVLYLTMSDRQREDAARKVLTLIKKHGVTLLSIGNGTASYETEQFAAKLIADHKLSVSYLITNEAGASVYSASKLAKEELPDYDVTIRGAVSIARRVQDPLAELVKIDPEAIGVGQYQHDVNQKALKRTLDAAVESAANHVGVELNTASAALLSHIAGINAAIAKNIISYRDENGRFRSRKELLKVPRLGAAAFTQSAGFLRIAGAKSPLDNTSVHPESYKLAEEILTELKADMSDLGTEPFQAKMRLLNAHEAERLAARLGAGIPTVRDILAALARPGRDPREDLPTPQTRKAVTKLSELKTGSVVKGVVRNITDFGVFVDIGIKTAGLIHISELAPRRVKHPLDVVSVGDILEVMIISIDEGRNRIGLSLKQVPKEARA
ncbi:Tex family protein [Selenomonas sp. TAMA-11512]|uniref:Tex family protein n=1 Tax=Selenomonas sp. TAMA-11512 TaxID=3095337 RepID=UPI0030924E96|nr:Tex family protein [Selenomonas sp. TAMA-11512]